MTNSAGAFPARAKTQNFVQFATERGLTTDADVLSHIHAGLRSMPTTKTYKRWNESTLARLSAERDAAHIAYRKAIADGEVIEPAAATLEEVAAGHPDRQATQAALRLLAKRAARLA